MTKPQHEIPPLLTQEAEGIPDVLLPYQKERLAAIEANPFVVDEKSRRIGITWGVGSIAVLTAGKARAEGGMDVIYIGYNLEMAREFIDVCGMWARSFAYAAAEVEEFLFTEEGEDGADRHIKAFRIDFGSGFEVVALSAQPRSLRGRQGLLIFDEAAFHDDLAGMIKAAMAFLVWGGKVVVISTHDGEDNPFNELIQDIRAGRRNGVVLRTTFMEAVEQGLYERVCLVRGEEPTDAGKRKFVEDIYSFYGEDAEEELDVIPAKGSGTAIPLALIEACSDPEIEVVRWTQPDSFALLSEHLREAETREFCERELLPRLKRLNIQWPSFLGEDFGRVADLTVLWPLQLDDMMVRRTPFVVELRNIPYEQQRQILFYIIDRLPRFSYGALDATGNGGYLAEVAQQKYGSGVIEAVMLSETWYREQMPAFKAAFEDRTITVPKDRDTTSDLRALKKIKGVIKLPEARQTGTDKMKRHGDSAIGSALAHYASRQEAHAYGYEPVARETAEDPDDRRMRMRPDEHNQPRVWNEGAW